MSERISNKTIFMIGVGASLGLGMMVLYVKRTKIEYLKQKYNKEFVIKVLKRFNRQYFPLNKLLWTTAQKSKKEMKTYYGDFSDEMKTDMKNKLLYSNPGLNETMKKMEAEVYGKFEIDDPSEFEYLCQIYSKEDEEIKTLMVAIDQNLHQSAEGIKMSMDIELPRHVSSVTTFKIYKDTIYKLLLQLNTFMKNYTANNGYVRDYKDFDAKLNKVIRPIEIKQVLLKKYKYDCSDDIHEDYFYTASIEKSSRNDPEFRATYQEIEATKNSIFDRHLYTGADFDILQDEIHDLIVMDYRKKSLAAELNFDEDASAKSMTTNSKVVQKEN